MIQNLARVLSMRRYRFDTEFELQDAVEIVLRAESLAYTREARLSEFDRLDFLVGDVAIEIKTRGTAADLIRQIHRYLQRSELSGLVMVSHLARLCRCLPTTINNKPVVAVFVGGGF